MLPGILMNRFEKAAGDVIINSRPASDVGTSAIAYEASNIVFGFVHICEAPGVLICMFLGIGQVIHIDGGGIELPNL